MDQALILITSMGNFFKWNMQDVFKRLLRTVIYDRRTNEYIFWFLANPRSEKFLNFDP